MVSEIVGPSGLDDPGESGVGGGGWPRAGEASPSPKTTSATNAFLVIVVVSHYTRGSRRTSLLGVACSLSAKQCSAEY